MDMNVLIGRLIHWNFTFILLIDKSVVHGFGRVSLVSRILLHQLFGLLLVKYLVMLR
mgnify:CR=1 FL=1